LLVKFIVFIDSDLSDIMYPRAPTKFQWKWRYPPWWTWPLWTR